MDEHLPEIMASLARVEERQGHLIQKIDNLEQVAMKRLNSHARDIDSLETTRDRQRGAAKLGAVGLMALGTVLAWLRFWD